MDSLVEKRPLLRMTNVLTDCFVTVFICGCRFKSYPRNQRNRIEIFGSPKKAATPCGSRRYNLHTLLDLVSSQVTSVDSRGVVYEPRTK